MLVKKFEFFKIKIWGFNVQFFVLRSKFVVILVKSSIELFSDLKKVEMLFL